MLSHLRRPQPPNYRWNIDVPNVDDLDTPARIVNPPIPIINDHPPTLVHPLADDPRLLAIRTIPAVAPTRPQATAQTDPKVATNDNVLKQPLEKANEARSNGSGVLPSSTVATFSSRSSSSRNEYNTIDPQYTLFG